MYDFDLVIVGAGGGPSETDLSSYFVKTRSSSWKDGILALEAGSGLGALTSILNKDPNLFFEREEEYKYCSDREDDKAVELSLSLDDTQDFYPRKPISRRKKHSIHAAESLAKTMETPAQTGDRIYSYITSWIVTHAHLDHVASLVLGAGSQGGPSRSIIGLEHTIRDLEGIFNGKLWPKLAVRQGQSAPDFFYRFKPLSSCSDYTLVAPNISARAMPVSHGVCAQSRDGTYNSSAWFIRNDLTHREFLFFGDVEPDTISLRPKTKAVWDVAATKINNNTLDTIFLECSWRGDRRTEELFGHLSPPFVLEELKSLARSIVDARTKPKARSFTSYLLEVIGLGQRPVPIPDDALRGVLKGVRLVVTHCKSSTEAFPDGVHISQVISDEVRALVEEAELGVTIVAARQGGKLEI